MVGVGIAADINSEMDDLFSLLIEITFLNNKNFDPALIVLHIFWIGGIHNLMYAKMEPSR